MLSTLVADTEQGIQNLMTDTDPYAATVDAATSSASFADLCRHCETRRRESRSDLTDIVNAFSSALSTAYSVLLPTADIINALATSLPAYDLSLFTDNIATGDCTDAFGLPIAANTALDTLAAGFAVEVLQSARRR